MKKLLLIATVLLSACSSSPSVVVPVTQLTGVWSGPLTFKNGGTFTVYVDFDQNASDVMVFQEPDGFISQIDATASYSAATRAVTVNWNDTVYSCASDSATGIVHATLNAGATGISGTFDYGEIRNDGTITLKPAAGMPTPIKHCAM